MIKKINNNNKISKNNNLIEKLKKPDNFEKKTKK